MTAEISASRRKESGLGRAATQSSIHGFKLKPP
ncbi:hypothetical protein PS627_00489 [Pseudomonas fluorescens]|nr:hypothetical protein PS627_00489 [Pseudomonas fluorescens]